MFFLLLSILSGITIVLCFKWVDRLDLNAFTVIVLNYLVAFLLGFILIKKELWSLGHLSAGEMVTALVLGILFVIMFRILGASVKTAGMGISTIAAKISVALPIAFSIIAYHEPLSLQKSAGIGLAMTALFLTVYQKENSKKHAFLLPVLLFAGMGIVDSMVKFVQVSYLKEYNILPFSALVFFISFFTGMIMKMIEKKRLIEHLSMSLFLTGILLGTANLGSLYFFIRALDSGFLDSSLIFTINNLSILILTVLTGVLFFRERLSLLNWAGFLLSLVSLYIIFEG
ncbi:MAG: hypothetical protein J7K46_11675 [Bacteroidales bacterium]|nr:hypothetical protein [Bacteroidales bacterium]